MYEQVARNKRRTFLLLAVFVLFIFLVALAFNFLLGYGAIGVAIAVVIAIAMAFGSYFESDKIALAATGARLADPTQYQRYHNLVEGLCIAAGLPKPRLYIVNDPAPNAFATGRNPKHAAIAVTSGLLEKMNRVELEGVLAHELSHIKNYDILVSTIAVTAVGVVVLLSDLGLRFMWFGGRRNRRDASDSNNPLGLILLLLALALLVLAPFFAQLMKMAVSRNREYLADVSGVELTRYPPGLISALEKLQADSTVVHKATKATAQLWIEEPLETSPQAKGSAMNRMFATHPPLADRIARLKEM
ncbi:MAG: zinc metalloprotease HtpX [Acidimicrobiia bacterium]